MVWRFLGFLELEEEKLGFFLELRRVYGWCSAEVGCLKSTQDSRRLTSIQGWGDLLHPDTHLQAEQADTRWNGSNLQLLLDQPVNR